MTIDGTSRFHVVGEYINRIISNVSRRDEGIIENDEERIKRVVVILIYLLTIAVSFVWIIVNSTFFIKGEVNSQVVHSPLGKWLATLIGKNIRVPADQIIGLTVSGIMILSTSFSIYRYFKSGNFNRFRNFLIVFAFSLSIFITLSLGGIIAGGAPPLWAFLAPLLALIAANSITATKWYFAYILFILIFGWIEPILQQGISLPNNQSNLYMTVTLIMFPSVMYIAFRYFLSLRDEALRLLHIEQAKSEGLLLNILPKPIAEKLKDHEGTIAEHYYEASVLFADLAGFTPMSEKMSPEEMVDLLNTIYSKFDELGDKYGIEKIRTIGDSYMAACGVPVRRIDHAQALANMALDMQLYAETLPKNDGASLQFRIGIHSGPLVAGIIGRRKFHYDVWGDTVNTASRMESHGIPGKIQTSTATHDILKNEFVFTERGEIEVKGKGKMLTWFIEEKMD